MVEGVKALHLHGHPGPLPVLLTIREVSDRPSGV